MGNVVSKVVAKYQIRKKRILRALLERGELSLTNLSRTTGMSLPMVSSVVASLKREQFVHRFRGQKNDGVGRPPFVAKLNGDAGYVLGIDIGHLNTNGVLLNLEQKVVAELHHPSLPLENSKEILDSLSEDINGIVKSARINDGRLLGIGLSIPGIVRGREGFSGTYLNFGRDSVRNVLQERWMKPVVIEHDAKAMALGERWFGWARNAQNVLCLNIGWGIGLGVILDGRIYYGRDGYAGEFGHLQVVPGGQLCQCGKRGCLETVASGRAIAALAQKRLQDGAVSKLSEALGPGRSGINAEQVMKSAIEGDQFAIEILEEAGRYLGGGVAILINLFNPELVILGGRVSGAKHFLLDAIRATALKQSLVQLNHDVRFVVSDLGTNAGALGVAMLAAKDIFEVEHLNPSAYV